jgi:renalase
MKADTFNHLSARRWACHGRLSPQVSLRRNRPEQRTLRTVEAYSPLMSKTIILGAGLAGLSAARQLQAHGHSVEIIDKGRGVGGRLATRRIGEARLDHGAQFFTTRGAVFTETIAQALDAGAVAEWCRGFAEQDGYPRYRGAHGMTSLAKWLAVDVPMKLGVEVDRIEMSKGQVSFVGKDDATIAQAPLAIVTAPIPQMLNLFDRGNVQPDLDLDTMLRATRYFATLALLAVVDGPPNIDEPGAMQFSNGPFTFIADNERKGISPVRALTFHAEHDYSLRRFDDDPEQVRAELLEQAAPWIGDATVLESQLKKWRYAGPVTPLPKPTYVIESDGARLALAGDAFAGPKVEGAFNSGHAAALELL